MATKMAILATAAFIELLRNSRTNKLPLSLEKVDP